MEFLYTLHSHNRWLVFLAAIAAIVVLCITWLRGTEYNKGNRIIVSVFNILMMIQGTIGIILLFNLGILRHRLEHAVVMTLAIGVVHMSARWKSLPGPLRARNTAVTIAVSLLLVLIGILALPQRATLLPLP